jgi:hypothetical protein
MVASNSRNWSMIRTAANWFGVQFGSSGARTEPMGDGVGVGLGVGVADTDASGVEVRVGVGDGSPPQAANAARATAVAIRTGVFRFIGIPFE